MVLGDMRGRIMVTLPYELIGVEFVLMVMLIYELVLIDISIHGTVGGWISTTVLGINGSITVGIGENGISIPGKVATWIRINGKATRWIVSCLMVFLMD